MPICRPTGVKSSRPLSRRATEPIPDLHSKRSPPCSRAYTRLRISVIARDPKGPVSGRGASGQPAAYRPARLVIRIPAGRLSEGGRRLTCRVPRPRVPATMTDRDLECFLLRIALPPVRLGLSVKRLKARSADPAARTVAIDELQRAARIRVRLARAGWWN